MFVSFEFIENEKNKPYRFGFKVVDTEFEEYILSPSIWLSVIDIYEKRNLPVAPNLIRCLIYFCETRNQHDIHDMFKWCKKRHPQFAKYKKELEKYLTLL
jgi:hypothetical protein